MEITIVKVMLKIIFYLLRTTDMVIQDRVSVYISIDFVLRSKSVLCFPITGYSQLHLQHVCLLGID